ncbi:MAG: GNAT family N-acetyltransferase [Anaerolineae bacterium]|nr:GNAT family N-acetyltransferase [Anaerolineae bacterium]MDW8171281.1 GNAT family N-acetyltransferase [Anaerolineae bacterium]
MTSPRYVVRPATPDDLDAVKALFDAERQALGFVLRPSLAESIHRGEILVVRDEGLLGAVHYRHRRDRQTTLYHIAVLSSRRRAGLGATLVEALKRECQARQARFILLKCPQGLPANQFYAAQGFQLQAQEAGKRRLLNVWTLTW